MDRKKAEQALINAHKAGDTESAQKIAAYLKDNPEKSYAKETLSNVPSSAAGAAKDTVSAALSPIDTAKGLVRSAAGGVGKLTQGMFDNNSIPALRTMGAFTQEPSSYDPYADAVGQHYSDRYGSLDKAKETFKNDPVGAALEVPVPVLGLLGVGRSVAKNTSRMIPESLPGSLYEGAAKFSTTLSDADRAKITNTALEAGVAPTRKGVAKLNNKIFDLNDQITGIINNADEAGVMIPKQSLYKYLDEARENLGGVKIDAAGDMASASKYIQQFDDWLKSKDKDLLTPKEVQGFKTNAYKKIKFDADNFRASNAKDEIRRATARGAKESLEEINPDIKSLNRTEGDLLELQPHLMRSTARIENRDILGLGPVFKMGAGSALNSPAIGAGVALLDLPKVKSNLAIRLHKSKNKDRKLLADNPVVQGLLMQQALEKGQLSDEYVDGLLGATKTRQ